MPFLDFISLRPGPKWRVRTSNQRPSALTIAGSDSGGGAGIQADLKTFAALGVHGTSVITCITAQNPRRVIGVEPCSVRIVEAQLEAVSSELPPRAAKTGMLFSAPLIRAVAGWARVRKCSLVVDPVMVATSGARLLKEDAVKALTKYLLPLATVITPNIPEAEALLDIRIREPEDLRRAARELYRRFGCATLVKGGHLASAHEAIDILFDGSAEFLLRAPRISGIRTHGTGCTYSAAIAAHLAVGEPLARAVTLAKTFVSNAIANHYRCGRHAVLNPGGSQA
jgi:hydroxymethylpyrimidine kinase/phosphomethylpyrimidine kinase